MKHIIRILGLFLVSSMLLIPVANAQNREHQDRGQQNRKGQVQDRGANYQGRQDRQGRQNAVMSEGRRPAHKIVGRNAHASYGTLPRWGATMGQRPSASVLIRSGNASRYYRGGVFYSRDHNGYRVDRAPRGIHVRALPRGYRMIMLGHRHYYYYFGSFYSPIAGGYVVVDPPLGAVVDALPMGYEVRNINGFEYYYFDGTFYAEVNAPEFSAGIGFQVVRP